MKVRIPIICLTLLLCMGISANAATYYVSSISGNDSYTPAQAQNSATPWKSLAKLNSFWGSINPGDVIMLQCGSVFTDPLQIWKGGTAAAGITITAYGSGNAPVLSGFGALGTWTNLGGNYWAASCSNCGFAANMVSIADTAQPMGRWPNAWSNSDAGYAQIQSYNGTVSITDSHIGSSGHNWTGANIAIKKERWIIENDTILSQSGNTITYKSQTTFKPGNKFGYFIQNNAGTLDVPGEWWYNPANKALEMYATVNPSTMKVQVSRLDTILYVNSVQYVTINGLAFQGANFAAIAMFRSNFITVQNCSINLSGRDAFDITTCNNLNFNNLSIRNTNNNGFMAYCNNTTIQNCNIAKTAAFPGMMLPANSGIGIYISGNNNNILYNAVDTTGYTGIYFLGSNNTIANNLVNYFCFVKDDGGGIYTWNGQTDSTDNHNMGTIKNNIVVNGVTCSVGTDSAQAPIAEGIYLDENSVECAVTGNTVAHCTGGVFFQDARHCPIQNNTLFDNVGQLVMRHALPTGTFLGNDVSNNICVSRIDTQYCVEASSIGPSTRLTSYEYAHNNHFAQLASGSLFWDLAFTDFYGQGTYGAWQSRWREDVVYSNLLPVNFGPYTINSYIGGNMYTKGNISTPFSTAAAGIRVITSAGVGAIDAGYYYVLNYTMSAPDNAHTMINFIEESGIPFPQVTPYVTVATQSPSGNYQVIWQATKTFSPCLLVFQEPSNMPSMTLSNISLYRANVTPNNPANNYIFQYNATRSAVTLPLTGTWQDAAGNSYSGSVSIPAFGSVVLIK